jgi:hypothetical protein
LAHAQAPQTNAPPGNSAVDEYLETVPGAGGNRRPSPPASGGAATSRGDTVLTAAQRARLERLGPDGKTLADAVESTSSAPAPSAAKQTAPREPEALDGVGRSPARELLDAVGGKDDGGGMGLLLPAILIAALLATITAALLRRRTSS